MSLRSTGVKACNDCRRNNCRRCQPRRADPLGDRFVVFLPTGQGVNPVSGTSWEGVGVKPDIAVGATVALSKAHILAIERLRAAAPDLQVAAAFDAVSMKLDSISQADAGVAPLSNADALGDYTPEVGAGTTVGIFEKDGHLVRHVQGLPDRALIHLKGNRYSLEGLPDGFAIAFRVRDGKPQLLLEQPLGDSVIRVRK